LADVNWRKNMKKETKRGEIEKKKDDKKNLS
jgi:hypothetical protein